MRKQRTGPPAPRRRWTRRELWDLMGAAERMSQEQAAALLGRTVCSVEEKVQQAGLRWRARCVSLTRIAAAVGCSPTTVAKLCRRLRVPQLTRCSPRS